MANACASCNGVGFGYVDKEFGHRGIDPCPVCNSGGDGKFSKPAPARKATAVVIDSPDKVADPDEVGMTLEVAVEEGVFSAEEAEASVVAELEASEK